MKKKLLILGVAVGITIAVDEISRNYNRSVMPTARVQRVIANEDSTYIVEIYDTTAPSSRELIRMWDSSSRQKWDSLKIISKQTDERGLISCTFTTGADTAGLDYISAEGFKQLLKGNIDSVYSDQQP